MIERVKVLSVVQKYDTNISGTARPFVCEYVHSKVANVLGETKIINIKDIHINIGDEIDIEPVSDRCYKNVYGVINNITQEKIIADFVNKQKQK